MAKNFPVLIKDTNSEIPTNLNRNNNNNKSKENFSFKGSNDK